MLRIIESKIKDKNLIWLIKIVLKNHKTETARKGMPLGNLTSQFFANVYLNELDHFVKHKLKVKYYMRYVDDFVILHKNKEQLEEWKIEIDNFLNDTLRVVLHPDKTKIIVLRNGITFLGFRLFYKHRLLKKSNARRIWKRIDKFQQEYDKGKMTIEDANRSLEGWFAYTRFANTYNFRKRVIARFKIKFLRLC